MPLFFIPREVPERDLLMCRMKKCGKGAVLVL